MLTTLYIKNYALIDELTVNFNDGFTSITGETGAGKSILLGGLSLVLGKRATQSQVKNRAKKCIIEAQFNIANYDLKSVFKTLALDYDVQTIIRREILPSGKSRAFINDTPTTLDALVALSFHLIDIHSQHQTQQLMQSSYQFGIIDAMAKNTTILESYKDKLNELKSLQRALEALKVSKAEMFKAYDYNLFLVKELNDVNLEAINLKDIEAKYDQLNNVEVIIERLNTTRGILNTETVGVIDQLGIAKQELLKISKFGEAYGSLSERMVSLGIELDDVLSDLDGLEAHLIVDPQELNHLNYQLKVINNLFQKHAVSNVLELVEIKNNLESKISNTESLDYAIAKNEKETAQLSNDLNQLASHIRMKRKAVIPVLISKLETVLVDLGMPNAKFKIELKDTVHFTSNGKDSLQFLFMANKGSKFNVLKKATSGGELSRIMLAIKSILSTYMQLPTIMFDEIDTGVSGEISNKMGAIMGEMSMHMQVFAITHLPQIAAKGNAHFKVFKSETKHGTQTQLKRLDEEARIVEIAQMLGGLTLTDSAVAHAKQLLN